MTKLKSLKRSTQRKKVKRNDDLQKKIVLNQKKYINRNASMDIANFIEKQLKENDK